MGGSPADWNKPGLDGSQSIADRVSALSGTTVWAFSYQKKALNWVTDASIGPRLAESISCLWRYTGKPVVVVDHSMGGLATQYAAAQWDSSGHKVASDIAEVIAIGTPFDGSKFLTVLQAVIRGGEGLSNPGLTAAAEALLSACAGIGHDQLAADSGDPCGALAVLRSPVGTDLMYRSAAIESLPAWPSSLPVKAVAGEIKITVGIWKLRHTFDLGDILVSQDSATAHNTDGSPARVTCNNNVLQALSSKCYHGRLPSNPAVVGQVLDVVRKIVAREQPPAPKPVPQPLPTTTATPPPATTETTPGSLQIGAVFDDDCTVAWPTAPTRTSQYIQMTMECVHLPHEYLLAVVVYPDPNFNVTPSTGRMHVHGRVVDIATSGYGFRELVVQADRVGTQ
jgi:pimeloyl-ACP methyl ester carboxylesterase